MNDKLKRLQALSPEKRALFGKMLKEKNKDKSKQTIKARGMKDMIPLSFAEQRLWFIDQLESGSSTYNLTSALKIIGKMNVDALVKSFEGIIRRHDVLRSSYRLVEGKPYRFVSESKTLDLRFKDIESLSDADKEDKVHEFIKKDSAEVFDLQKGEVLRINVIKLSSTEHVLILTLHHIVTDGWSMGILVGEFMEIYRAYYRGNESPLNELELQYGDYAQWQKENLADEVVEKQLEYWKDQLGGLAPYLDFPTDRLRPKVTSNDGGEVSFEIPKVLSEKVKKLSREEGCTLFTTLLSGFKFLLARYSGINDIAVGTTIANRPIKDLEGLIGLFINSLALRSDVSGHQTFKDLLAAVKATTLNAYKHQDVPFDAVVDSLKLERSLSYAPVTQIRFVMNNVPMTELKLPDLELQSLPLSFVPAKMDLILSIIDRDSQLYGAFTYSKDLFDRETIENLAKYYLVVLENIVENPNRRLSDYQLADPYERAGQEIQSEEAKKQLENEQCIHSLLEYYAELSPDKTAVVYEDNEYSYSELNQKANQLAHFLKSKGVRTESKVGLSLPYSLETIVGIFGIMKAGGVYVPIDCRYPKKRIKSICDDAHIQLVISSKMVIEDVRVDGMETVALDAWQGEAYSDENLELEVSPDQLAYMIYTSGSTGKPKGVCVEHKSLQNYVYSVLDRLNLSPNAEMASMSSIAADLGYTALFGSLCSGRTLRVLPEETYLDAAKLQKSFQKRPIDALKIVPSHLATLLAVEKDLVLPNECLVLGGEALHGTTVEEISRRKPKLRIVNHYGPTESTVGALSYDCSQMAANLQRVPIGHAMANCKAYVLDENLNPCLAGAPGDLYLAGTNLARGYWNEPGKTAERFTPDHLSQKAGGRLYKTGDRARYLNGGIVQFLGRTDHQVKVNGYRVEIGEIELAIKSLAEVQDTVVQLEDISEGNTSLTAYIVSSDGSFNDDEVIRATVLNQLPDYMVPRVIKFISEIPRLGNGKVDLKALKTTECETHEKTKETRQKTKTEEVIAEIWKKELNLENVGLTDCFFQIGGHSLLGVLVSFRISEVFDIDFSVSSLVSNSRLQSLAAYVDSQIENSETKCVLPLIPRHRGQIIPISLSQERLWFLHQRDPKSNAYYMPSSFQIEGKLNIIHLEKSFKDLVQRHEILRTTFSHSDEGPVQVIHDCGVSELNVKDLSHMSAEEKKDILDDYLQRRILERLDIVSGPLFRATLLRMSENDHVMLTCTHHIISDGWSQRVIVDDFFSIYEGYEKGEAAKLRDLPIQFADYALWERDYLSAEKQQREIDFWNQKLDGAPALLKVPTDFPRTSNAKPNREMELFRLPTGVKNRLEEICQRNGVTLYNLLMLSFKLLLARYSGQNDVVVGTTVANRSRKELEGVIGFFVNQLALRTVFDEKASFEDFLVKEAEEVNQAFSHMEVPFSIIVRSLDVERSNLYSPVFQCLFVLQNIPDRNPKMGELKVSGLQVGDIENAGAKFDLTLVAGEGEDGDVATIIYNADLFRAETISEMAKRYIYILETIAAQPSVGIEDIAIVSEEEKALIDERKREGKKKLAGKLSLAKRRSVDSTTRSLVHCTPLSEDRALPLVITPAMSDVNLKEWIANNKEFVRSKLLHHAGVLFRGFQKNEGCDFFDVAKELSDDSLMGDYGDLPKDGKAKEIYKSTPYPKDQIIHFHSESSHLNSWPGQIMFSCVKAAEKGGETAIVDCRTLYQVIDPKIIKVLEEKGLMYVRNYIEKIDVSWQRFFGCESKREVEERCRLAGMEYRWKEDNTLETRKKAAAIRQHPKTGEMLFFNQMLLSHASCLNSETYEALRAQFSLEDFPRNVYYGDGSAIDDAIVDEIRAVMDENSSNIVWQEGDIVALDNMLSAHARLSFEGERKIIVAIGNEIHERDFV